jgi:hypothetical protein
VLALTVKNVVSPSHLRRTTTMGVDPWAEENDEHETRGYHREFSGDDGNAELEREARRRRDRVRNGPSSPNHRRHTYFFSRTLPNLPVPTHLPSQFWSEGYRDGIEEGKKATVQSGFNVGFREGATAGLAFGQARGAAISVGIFAGQVPGSSEWKSEISQTMTMVAAMTPRDASVAAGVDFEKTLLGNENSGDGDGTGDGETFADKTSLANRELETAGFKHREFDLEG